MNPVLIDIVLNYPHSDYTVFGKLALEPAHEVHGSHCHRTPGVRRLVLEFFVVVVISCSRWVLLHGVFVQYE